MKNAILKITGENGVTMGVAPVERLSSPPSADPRYLMPDCHSVIALLHPLDTGAIQAYLGKKDQSTFQEHEKNINIKVIQTADRIVEHLKKIIDCYSFTHILTRISMMLSIETF